MAKVVKGMPNGGQLGRPRKYDWDNWLDGQTWELVQGEDFTIDMHAMRSSAHGMAARKQVKVITRTDGPNFYIQAVPR